jgi:hypothetical protein
MSTLILSVGGYGCIIHKLSQKCLHPYGGVGLPNGLQPVVFHEDCCGKSAYFQMENNGAIRHVQSNRCIRQKREFIVDNEYYKCFLNKSKICAKFDFEPISLSCGIYLVL